MTIELKDIQFDNDFYFINFPDDSILYLNNIDECFTNTDGEEQVVNRINLELHKFDDTEQTLYIDNVSNAIGIDNGTFMLNTDYDEYKGKVLTQDNIKYCKVVFYEDVE